MSFHYMFVNFFSSSSSQTLFTKSQPTVIFTIVAASSSTFPMTWNFQSTFRFKQIKKEGRRNYATRRHFSTFLELNNSLQPDKKKKETDEIGYMAVMRRSSFVYIKVYEGEICLKEKSYRHWTATRKAFFGQEVNLFGEQQFNRPCDEMMEPLSLWVMLRSTRFRIACRLHGR